MRKLIIAGEDESESRSMLSMDTTGGTIGAIRKGANPLPLPFPFLPEGEVWVYWSVNPLLTLVVAISGWMAVGPDRGSPT
jgi:hypothetical protein